MNPSKARPFKVTVASCCFLLLIAILPSHSWSQAVRFQPLTDGSIKDMRTGLVWAPRDNGSSINWSQAVLYCRNYSLGGHQDWRMPTSQELGSLYGNTPKKQGQDYQLSVDVITPLIQISAPWVWSTRRRPKNKSMAFGFNYGVGRGLHRGNGVNRRALPVRTPRGPQAPQQL